MVHKQTAGRKKNKERAAAMFLKRLFVQQQEEMCGCDKICFSRAE